MSVTTKPILVILLLIISFCLDIIGPCSIFYAVIKTDSVSLMGFPLLNHIWVISCAISSVCHSKYPYICFSTHFYFLDFVFLLSVLKLILLLLVAAIILFLPFFSVLLTSSNCGIFTILNTSEFLSFIFSWYRNCQCYLSSVRSFVSLSLSLSFSLFVWVLPWLRNDY